MNDENEGVGKAVGNEFEHGEVETAFPEPSICATDFFRIVLALDDSTPEEKKLFAWYMRTMYPGSMEDKEFADFVKEHKGDDKLLPAPSPPIFDKFKTNFNIDLLGWYEKLCEDGKKRPATAGSDDGENPKKRGSDWNSWKQDTKQKCRTCKEEDKTDRDHDCRPTIEMCVRLIKEILDRDFESVNSIFYRIACEVEDEEHGGGGGNFIAVEPYRRRTASAAPKSKVHDDELIHKAMKKFGLEFDKDGNLIL